MENVATSEYEWLPVGMVQCLKAFSYTEKRSAAFLINEWHILMINYSNLLNSIYKMCKETFLFHRLRAAQCLWQ